MPKRKTPQKVLVESSASTNYRPRQPKIRKTPPPGTKPLQPKGGKPSTAVGLRKASIEKRYERENISAETIRAAAATGMLPHEWLLAVMRGEQINHFAYDADTQEIVEIIVLPTFTDRIECAKAAAPFFASRMSKPGGVEGTPNDPTKARGVLAIPLVASVDEWIDAAGKSQAKLKKDVVK